MRICLTNAPRRMAALVVSSIAVGGMLSLATAAPALASAQPAHVASLTAYTVTAPLGHTSNGPSGGGCWGGHC